MNISDIKKLSSLAKWDAIVQRDPQVQAYKERPLLENQGADLYLSGYEKGINDAQTQKTPSMAASR